MTEDKVQNQAPEEENPAEEEDAGIDELDIEEIMQESFLQPGETPEYFTQKQVSKIAAQQMRRGAKTAAQKKEQEVAETLGVSIDEAKEIIAQHHAQEEASKSELERLQGDVTSKDSRITQLENELNTMRINSALEHALREEGIKDGRIRLAVKLADKSALEWTDEGKLKGIKQSIKGLKDESPEWFVEDTGSEESPQLRRGPAPVPPAADNSQLTAEQRQAAVDDSYSAVRSAF